MHLAFALPPPDRTGSGGGADYTDGLAAGLRQIGVAAEMLPGDEPRFPAGSTPVVDGMLLPTLRHRLDELVARDAVILVHHIAAAASHDEAAREQVGAIEAEMLPRFRRVAATSAPVAERLAERFGVAARAILPGVRDAAASRPDPADPVILSVGVLTRRKGHDKLLRAAARLVDLPWRLLIAGDTQRDAAHPDELRALAAELGVADRVTLLADPAPDALEQAWRGATVFALATRWEGYPTAIAESLQRGVPSLVTAGANAEPILPPSAGLICPLDDMATFGKCLRRLLFDDALRQDMAAAAFVAGRSLPRWPDRAREFAAFLEEQR